MRALLFLIFVDPRHARVRYRWAIMLYLVVVAIGAIPGARANIGHYASGLVLHSTAYAILAALLFAGSPGSERGRAFKSVLTVAMLGALDEFIQSFLPYRRASILDWMVDCTAALLTCLLLWAVWPKATRQPPP